LPHTVSDETSTKNVYWPTFFATDITDMVTVEATGQVKNGASFLEMNLGSINFFKKIIIKFKKRCAQLCLWLCLTFYCNDICSWAATVAVSQ
jgi:hypothetical protein